MYQVLPLIQTTYRILHTHVILRQMTCGIEAHARKQIENKPTPTLTQTNNASTSDHNLLNPESRQNMTIPSDSEEQQPTILESPAKKQLLHNNVGID
jgi:hypothetical protein